jgi:hypothetical protein
MPKTKMWGQGFCPAAGLPPGGSPQTRVPSQAEQKTEKRRHTVTAPAPSSMPSYSRPRDVGQDGIPRRAKQRFLTKRTQFSPALRLSPYRLHPRSTPQNDETNPIFPSAPSGPVAGPDPSHPRKRGWIRELNKKLKNAVKPLPWPSAALRLRRKDHDERN